MVFETAITSEPPLEVEIDVDVVLESV